MDTAPSHRVTDTKNVLTEAGPVVELEVPRDRDSSFEPKIVAKRQRRRSGVEDIVISLSAKGLTTGRSLHTWLRCTEPTCPSRRSRRSPSG